jgi:hypothetical protein
MYKDAARCGPIVHIRFGVTCCLDPQGEKRKKRKASNQSKLVSSTLKLEAVHSYEMLV